MTSLLTVALLHPGQMGAAIGRELVRSGVPVLWCPTGRSAASARRASEAGLRPVADLGQLLSEASIAISLCPPAAAEETAASVREAGFTGVFVEANAISPERAGRIADDLTASGAQVVDGSVIGPPPGGSVGTHLYLSGVSTEVSEVVKLFEGTAVEPIAIDGPVGRASALKMAYGSYQKATCALAAVAQALADAHGVSEQLTAEARRLAKSPLATPDYLSGVAAKAWRWAPEMREVADTLASTGLPSDLAAAAASAFELWNGDKDNFDIPLPDVLAHLRTNKPASVSDQ
ncbi:DUF1932 domain-containing protein [Nocardiopsis sp. LOL_012]|uniref:NAD(P)-dependent oxidoreductase n=1 Tax=Nocardiopsis sp. LOL_012 TaxID=3345409 RepID=UPI003A8A44BC